MMSEFMIRQLLPILLLVTISIAANAFSCTIRHQERPSPSCFCHSLRRTDLSAKKISLFEFTGNESGDNSERRGVIKNEVKKLNYLSRKEKKVNSKKIKLKRRNRKRQSGGIRKSIVNRWRRCRQKIRYMVFRNTVYVLECEDDKYYVGSTSNRKQRYRQHFAKRGGSTWTRLHKPIRVIDEYKRIPSRYLMGMEAQKTAEYMMKYGVNNVRGAGYCTSREFTIDNAADLTTFLGHYNQLSYRDLRRQLREVLPEPDSSTSSSQSARYSGQFPKSKAESSNNNVNGRYRNNLISNEEREEAITRQQIRKDKRKRRRKRKRHALGKDEATCDKCGQKDDWNCCPSDDNQANFSDQVEWRVQFEEN